MKFNLFRNYWLFGVLSLAMAFMPLDKLMFVVGFSHKMIIN